MFSGQFYEKWVFVRERNIKLLLETHIYSFNRNSHLHSYNRNNTTHNCNRGSYLHNYNKKLSWTY